MVPVILALAVVPPSALSAPPNSGAITYSSNTTLRADVFCTDLTINAGVALTTNGFNIFCSGTVTNNGVIQTGFVRNGGTGANESPAGATGGGAFPNSYGGSGGGGGGSAAISLGFAESACPECATNCSSNSPRLR
jgi:hypothetical protein